MPDSDSEQLLDFVRRRLLKQKGARVDADTPLFERRLIDSINILYLIGYVEKALGRRLTDDEIVMSNFRSVRVIAETFLRV
ncbi:MAG: acyl carrier protein [Candidatus Dormibacteraeota bacterium]|nr:acyl carrier protein [Candidatus Dormibacteraeota bacterium]